jgi:hypothetical protein
MLAQKYHLVNTFIAILIYVPYLLDSSYAIIIEIFVLVMMKDSVEFMVTSGL